MQRIFVCVICVCSLCVFNYIGITIIRAIKSSVYEIIFVLYVDFEFLEIILTKITSFE